MPSYEQSAEPLHSLASERPGWWERASDVKDLMNLFNGPCVSVESTGKTCVQNDPCGPASCHCIHCNVQKAAKKLGLI